MESCITYKVFSDCPIQQGGCTTAYVKTGLKTIKVTPSTAKLRFNVPQQSMLVEPLASGWTLSIKRAGTNKLLADYTIEDYEKSTGDAIFFVDDTLRGASNGYWIGEVKKDCCVVARVMLNKVCDTATSVSVEDFKYDPSPSCAVVTPKPAVCEKPCIQPVINPCGGCEC